MDHISSKAAESMAYNSGQSALARGDHASAAAHYLKAAENGHAEAAYTLGLLFSGGGQLPENKSEAFKWMRMSAEKGYAPAQEHLGMWYMVGGLVPEEPAEAVRWFRKAADQGERSAMYFLGTLYAGGEGVPKDVDAALGWFQMAAAKGFPVPPGQLTKAGVEDLGRKSRAGRTAPAEASRSSAPGRPATVKNVQDGLTKLGYDPGPADGIMGKKTANAIKAFQQDVNLPVDGKVSPELMRRIDAKLSP